MSNRYNKRPGLFSRIFNLFAEKDNSSYTKFDYGFKNNYIFTRPERRRTTYIITYSRPRPTYTIYVTTKKRYL
jgi:hypothetical protein